jgi:hypothetical protein
MFRSCDTEKSIKKSEEGNENLTYNKSKEGSLIGHILSSKCLLNTLLKGI